MDHHDHTIFCLGGVPGVGKSTVRAALLRRFPGQVVFLSRYTTRKPRSGEEGEVVQLDREHFCDESASGHLTARFCSNHAMYALSIRELHRLISRSHRWIGCISLSAGLALQERGFGVKMLYLTVRDRAVLVERLRARGHTEEEIAMRMHEYDTQDAEWRDLSGGTVLYTDAHSINETVDLVAHHLGLTTPAALQA